MISWIIRQIPRREPKFHQFEIFEGGGRSISALLMILITGEDLCKDIFISLKNEEVLFKLSNFYGSNYTKE